MLEFTPASKARAQQSAMARNGHEVAAIDTSRKVTIYGPSHEDDQNRHDYSVRIEWLIAYGADLRYTGVMNATLASFHPMFTHCPKPTAVVEGSSLVAQNAAFRAYFGEATSLLECLEPDDHQATIVLQNVGTSHACFTARIAFGEAAGKPMRWTAWTLGETMTCVQLDGEAAPSNPRLAPLAPILPKDKPAPELAWFLYEMFQRLDAIAFAMDTEGTIILSEGNGLAHFGLKPGQVVGRNAHQIYAPGSASQINTRKALNGERLQSSAMEGTSYFVTWHEPVHDDKGEQTGLLGLAICIDANSKAMLEARFLIGAIEQLPVALWGMERDGTCLFATGTGLRDLGFDTESLIGKNLFEVFADLPSFVSNIARVFLGERVTVEVRIGERTWRNHFVPAYGLLEKDVVRVYAVAENITERVQNERRLEEQLGLIQAQQRAIVGLSCPIIEVWQGVLVVPLIGNLDESRAGSLVEQLLQQVVARQAVSVILDLTGVDRIDAGTAPHISDILRSVELLGASGLISGIRPNVAKMMVELDIPVAAKNTYPTLAEALRTLIGLRRAAAAKR